jgi:hypothetical protein
MSTNLLRRLAEYRNDLDAAIETHRAATLVEPIETPRPDRRRLLLAVAVVALITCGFGLVVAVTLDGRSQESVSGVGDTTAVTGRGSIPNTASIPSTTIDPEAAWSWLDQFGGEALRIPPVPTGWKVLDFEAFRFAVPEDWVVPGPNSCALPAPGFVLIAATEPTMCAPSDPPPQSVLSILPAADAGAAGTPTTIGTLSAVEILPNCVGCAPVYLFDTAYQLTVSGPEAEQVLDTFTDSGFNRVLQSDAPADTSTWKTVEYQGIAFRVPGDWPVVNNESNPSDPADPSSQVDPGTCGTAMFPSDSDAHVSLGSSRMIASCAVLTDFDLTPGDGLWIRSTADSRSQPDGTPIAHGVVDGLDVTVVRMHRTEYGAPSPALDLVVRDGSAPPIWVSLGVGTDTSIARSILRSLHTVRGGS